MSKLFLICGILFTAYYIGIIVYAGIHASFAWIWAALGAVCWLALAVCRVSALQAAFLRVPAGLRMGAGALLALGILLFLAAEGCILSGMAAGGNAPCDYVIVLGAQVRGSKPSRSLLYRIEAAAEYMKANPDTVAIASGGQGDGEAISEACCIRRTLEKMGIQRDRIIEENRSVSTWENLRYSLGIGGRDASYIIATNSFHIYRALKTAKAVGMTRCAGLGARSHPLFQLNYFVREIFALAKLYMKLGAERIRS